MDSDEFREAGRQMVELAANYVDTLRERPVYPEVSPDYIRALIPTEAPHDPQPFSEILGDIERVIMPGVTHWNHPSFFAYFPTGHGYPSILADILSDVIGCIGFTWAASPACTDLEVVMMDWLAKACGLPDHFLSTSERGGGCIQGTASEATLMTMLAARNSMKEEEMGRLVAYSSALAHSSVRRATQLAGVKYRLLPTDEDHSLRGAALRAAVEEDTRNGLVPFFCVATVGTTDCCSSDNVREIASVCNELGLWAHVDAAYAGSQFVCEELRQDLDGIELVDSYNFNPHKWLTVIFDCSTLWLKDKQRLSQAFLVDPKYLQHDNQRRAVDFRHWQIPLGRRFRSLKLWFTMRLYGISGLQSNIRSSIALAERFEKLVVASDQFELFCPRRCALVCFRLKGSNEVNEKLHSDLNATRKIHLTGSEVSGCFFLRLAICSSLTTEQDVDDAWQLIHDQAYQLLATSA